MTRYDLWLDGLGLQDVDPTILITDVQEQAPGQALTTAARCAGDGAHVLRRTRQSLGVTIRLAVREYQPARRSAVLQGIRAWARHGGSLTSSHRPGQRLLVEPGSLSATSALRWTEELTLAFTAHHVPFWEDAFPTQLAASQAPFNLPGDAPAAPLDLHWCSTLTGAGTLRIVTPLSSLTFRGLPLSANHELLLTHEKGVLTATLNGADILPLRTPESSDDLLVPCGQASNVSVLVNDAVPQGCILSARGRWL